MTTKTKKLIELARRAKGVEGAEKWGASLIDTEGGVRRHIGPLLPYNPLDPMNPAACLKRAGTIGVHWVCQHPNGENENILSLSLSCAGPDYPPIIHGWPQEYEDYMEALLNLHDLAISEGGEWSEAWARAMSPDCEGE